MDVLDSVFGLGPATGLRRATTRLVRVARADGASHLVLVLAPGPRLPDPRASVIVPVSGNGTGDKLSPAAQSRQDTKYQIATI